MECRTAAHALVAVATLLELHGEDRFTVRAVQGAARLVAARGDQSLADALLTGAISRDRLGPDAAAVIDDLIAHGSAARLERLQEETPEGLLEMLRVPGLGPARIRQLHRLLHVETLQDLEQAARDGRLAALPRFGERTAERLLRGLADLRAAGASVLWEQARAEAGRIAAVLREAPDVLDVAIAGSIRRRCELVRDIDLVVAVRGTPSVVAATLAHGPGVREVLGGGGRTVTIRYDGGVAVDVACVRPEQFPLALWRATGSAAHVQQVTERAAARGLVIAGDELRAADGTLLPVRTEADLYAHLGLAWLEPELREGAGELEAAASGPLGPLVTAPDLRGALHCHSHDSDGGSSIAVMADAARARGLAYLGISDHSQSNTYAGGLSRDAIARQHDEIDALNAAYRDAGVPFRLLKGIEADILPCGRLDYDPGVLDRFDFVIGSIHSRFGLDERRMTDRVLKALDDPHLTILGHPTGRLLLAREPYAIDMRAIVARAAEVGVALELNADPHRLDIDWRACRLARAAGALVSIGPDAHSPAGLDHLALGVGIARKGWLAPEHVLNTRSADEIVAFARARRRQPALRVVG